MLKRQPNPEKIAEVKELTELLNSYPTVGILNLYKIPTIALQRIKYELYGKAIIKVVRKNMIAFALEKTKDKKSLVEYLSVQPALILTKLNPFKLFLIIQKSKSTVAAKPGDIATADIIVRAAPTDMPPGPAIATLTKVGIPAKVESGKIAIIRDKVVCKAGEHVSADLATALNLLKLEPMEIGLNVVALLESGIIYTPDVLAIDEEKLLCDICTAAQQALNLSIEACYPTKDNIELMIAKSFREAKSLSLETGIISKDIIGELLAKAVMEVKELELKIPITKE